MDYVYDTDLEDDFIGTTFDWDTYDTLDATTIGTDEKSVDGVALAGALAFLGIYIAIILAIAVFMTIAVWKIFKKAGRNGWEAIIPVYNNWVMYEIVGMKGWYALLALIPFVGGIIALVFSIMACIRLAKAFNKDGGYAVGLILLPIVFYPILGFGKDNVFYGVDENGNTLSGPATPTQEYQPQPQPQDPNQPL